MEFSMKALLAFISLSLICSIYGGDVEYIEDIFKPLKSHNLSKKTLIHVGYKQKLMQCFKDELVVSDIIKNDFSELKKAFIEKKGLMKFGRANNYPDIKKVKYEVFDEILYTKLSTKNFKVSLKNYLRNFDIKDVELSVVDYKMPLNLRTKSTLVPNEVTLKTNFDFRGYDKNKFKRQDRGVVHLKYTRVKGKWTLNRLEMVSGEILKSKKKGIFTKKVIAALSAIPSELRSEAIRRGGYALAVNDINGDGKSDILIGTRSGLKLYIQGKNGYEEKKNAGLDGFTYVKTAVFADLDNSGTKDLFITRLSKINGVKGTKNPLSVVVLKGKGDGSFGKAIKINHTPREKILEPMPAAVGDFNQDGLLELYVGYPGVRDFTTASSTRNNKGFQPQGIYINQGSLKFKDFTDKFTKFGFEQGKLFPHASVAVNFDQKNGVDLLVVDDRGNLSPAFVSNGSSFDQSAKEIGLGHRGYGMSVAAGDLNNDGLTDIAFTSVNFSSLDRLKASCARHFNVSYDGIGHSKGIRLFSANKAGSFSEQNNVGLDSAGFGAAGVVFYDYNHDGLEDIYLVNGLWSGTRKGDVLDSQFNISTYFTDTSLLHSLKAEDRSGFKGFLYNARGLYDYKNLSWKPSKDDRYAPSLAGFQRNRLFRNNGNGSFTEVGYFENVDSIADGYVVSKGDVNNDGVDDLVLRNADPGTKNNKYNIVEVYINKHKPVYNSYTLSLKGNKSPTDAYGAYVISHTSKSKRTHHLIANSGAAQDESKIRIYLGKSETLNHIEVYWPSGQIDKVMDLIPGENTLYEGKVQRKASTMK
jgi:hypothetical protein